MHLESVVPPGVSTRRALWLLRVGPVLCCFLLAFLLTWFFRDSVYGAGPGLQRLGYYAPEPPPATPFCLGNSPVCEFVLAGTTPSISSYGMSFLGGWFLGPSAESRGWPDTKEAGGIELLRDHTYDVQRGALHKTVSISRVARISASHGGPSLLTLFPLRPGVARIIAGRRFVVEPDLTISDSQTIHLRLNSSATFDVERSMVTVRWLPDSDGGKELPPVEIFFGEQTPGSDSLLWPGSSLSDARVKFAVHYGSRIKLFSTDLTSSILVGPGGIASALRIQSGEVFNVGQEVFRLWSLHTDQGHFSAIIRTPASGRNSWTRNVLMSVRDSSLFQPYSFVRIQPCEQARTILSVTTVLTDQGETGFFAEGAVAENPTRNSASLPAVRRLLIAPPRWMPHAARDLTIEGCTSRGRLLLYGRDNRGNQIDPPISALLKKSPSSTPAQNSMGSVSLRPGDAILFAGQVFGFDEARPRAVAVLENTLPAAFAAAALPLMVLLGFRQANRWPALRSTSLAESSLNRLISLCPSFGALAIVAMITTGAMYHLRLAASAELGGSTAHLTQFVVFNLTGLAVAAGAIALAHGLGLQTAISAGLSSVSLSSVVACIVEPVLYRRALLLNPNYFALPVALWSRAMIPLVFGCAAAATMVLWRRGSPQPKNTGEKSRYEKFLDQVYFSQYHRWVALPARNVVPADVTWWQHPIWSLAPPFRAFGFFTSVAIVPVGLCWAISKAHFPVLPEIGRQTLPVAVLIWAAAVTARLALTVLSEKRLSPLSVQARGSGAFIGTALFFCAALWLLPSSMDYADDGRALAFGAGALTLGLILGAVTRWQGASMLLCHIVPFFAILLGLGLAFSEVGVMLVWTWALSLTGAIFVVLTALIKEEERNWTRSFSYLYSAVLLAALPFLSLVTFNTITKLLGGEATNVGLGRAISRFHLAKSPFYYDAGEWLARAQLMATGKVVPRWIQNLNSDLALNGLSLTLRGGLVVFACAMAVLLLVMILAFAESYRRAVLIEEVVERGRTLRACLVGGSAIVSLGMMILIHLGASTFDVLPLTGVPCPWLSHSNVSSLVFTVFVLVSLQLTSEASGRVERSMHARDK